MGSRWLVLCAVGAVVLALHAGALSVLRPARLDSGGPRIAPAPFLVRSVTSPPPAPAPAGAEVPAKAVVAPMPLQRAAAGAASVVAARPVPVGVATTDRSDTAAELPSLRSPTSAAPIAAVDSAPLDVPVYPTRLPPAGHWRYRLQRGLLVGQAELDWAPDAGERYTLHLLGRVGGATLLEWASQGTLDAAGVAPERFAVRRRGRDVHAANFQRAAGKITFSGPTHEVPLLPGAQDRLSWMVQLPAVVAAEPGRHGVGTRVLLFVAGARGDADAWTFVVQGVETLDATPTLKLVREPRKLYDTRAEVWLDPAEHYLPLRVVQTPSGGGAALELWREREREPR